jgi:hypothetical protein
MGTPVSAVAEAQVAFMGWRGAYGNLVVLDHGGNYYTYYAHLSQFAENLAVGLKLLRGEELGLVGSTGRSTGPHLHFEIRDAEENILDPSQFGFAELKDNVSPIIQQISLKCMSADARINGKFGIFNFSVVKGKDGLYRIPQKITAKGTLGLEVLTYDRANNSPFRQGVNQINLVVNHKPVYNFRLDKMAFHNKLDMNTHVNYEKMNKTGQKTHKCYVEEGNSFDFYKTNESSGKFLIENDTNVVELRVNDAFANTVLAEFQIIREKENSSVIVSSAKIKTDVLDNFLKIEVSDPNNEYTSLGIQNENSTNQVPFDETLGQTKVKIIDLKSGFPESITLNGAQIMLPLNAAIKKANPVLNLENLKADFKDSLIKIHVGDRLVVFSLTPHLPKSFLILSSISLVIFICFGVNMFQNKAWLKAPPALSLIPFG